MEEIVSPIIIVGTGRCGSTILHEMLAQHPDVAWLTRIIGKYPYAYRLHRLSLRVADIPFARRRVWRFIKPVEGYSWWDSVAPGFRRPMRDLRSRDVTRRTKERVCNMSVKLLTPSRYRLLLKITGWPRLGYLQEIFPDAKFIHIVRDGRAVANSLLNVRFWDGWQGPPNWRLGHLPEKMELVWEKSGRSFVVLAGIEWMIIMDAIEKSREEVPAGQFLEIKYEDLVGRKAEVMKRVIEFTGLRWCNRFASGIKSISLQNMNFKYKRDLAEHQQAQLRKVLEGYLQRFGYT